MDLSSPRPLIRLFDYTFVNPSISTLFHSSACLLMFLSARSLVISSAHPYAQPFVPLSACHHRRCICFQWRCYFL